MSSVILQGREKQMARLLREDELGACQLELANRRVLRLAQLRCGGSGRCTAAGGAGAAACAASATVSEAVEVASCARCCQSR